MCTCQIYHCQCAGCFFALNDKTCVKCIYKFDMHVMTRQYCGSSRDLPLSFVCLSLESIMKRKGDRMENFLLVVKNISCTFKRELKIF